MNRGNGGRFGFEGAELEVQEESKTCGVDTRGAGSWLSCAVPGLLQRDPLQPRGRRAVMGHDRSLQKSLLVLLHECQVAPDARSQSQEHLVAAPNGAVPPGPALRTARHLDDRGRAVTVRGLSP